MQPSDVGLRYANPPTADFVVVGTDPGTKFDDATRLGVPILDEAAFKTLIGKR